MWITWLLTHFGGEAGETVAKVLGGIVALHWIDAHPGLLFALIGAGLMGYVLWKAPSQDEKDDRPLWLHLALVLIFQAKYLFAALVALMLVLAGLGDITGYHRFVDESVPPAPPAKVQAPAPNGANADGFRVKIGSDVPRPPDG